MRMKLRSLVAVGRGVVREKKGGVGGVVREK